MSQCTQTIVQADDFIILSQYQNNTQSKNAKQSEKELENELIEDLKNLGYKYIQGGSTHSALLANLKKEIERLNNVELSDKEWQEFYQWLNPATDTSTDCARRFHDSPFRGITRDDGSVKNIYLFDRQDLTRNHFQIMRQAVQGNHNRYDVTILMNGLPVVQIELKQRGVSIEDAFGQQTRYQHSSYNAPESLYKFLQVLIISNGTFTRYFANTLSRDKSSYIFTNTWALENNSAIHDLKDFTQTFLAPNTLVKILLRYAVFNTKNELMLLRPYQIAATERILRRIQQCNEQKAWDKDHKGGYIWHTTGSGKTLTSFKTAQLASALPYVKKVLFVVDRKDLDDQTVQEYAKFSEDSSIGTESTRDLKAKLSNNDDRIIVTTIQKLGRLVQEKNLDIYQEKIVFIFDECHRSQFGEAQAKIRKRFKNYCQFGFTGTPIFIENAYNQKQTTENVFGEILHRYLITHALADENVLKFKLDYYRVFQAAENAENAENNQIANEQQQTENEASTEDITLNEEDKKTLLHPARIKAICQRVLKLYPQKTQQNREQFNAIFAVDSIDAAKMYYDCFKKLQAPLDEKKRLKIATIFSAQVNETPSAKGETKDEDFATSALSQSHKAFLQNAVTDFQKQVEHSNTFDLNSADGFRQYYATVSKKMKSGDIDLLIVVGMFLTGFDVPRTNTLFVDKSLRFHGLIQAFSRTNRILNKNKQCGNIITFRNLINATNEAIKLFNQTHDDEANILLIQVTFEQLMQGYKETIKHPDTQKTQEKTHLGLIELANIIKTQFPEAANIARQKEAHFAKVFGEYLRCETLLKAYDEYLALRALKSLDEDTPENIAQIQEDFGLDDEALQTLMPYREQILSPFEIQNYSSAYQEVWRKRRERERFAKQDEQEATWQQLVFEIDLVEQIEINLEYIENLLGDLANSKNIDLYRAKIIEKIQQRMEQNESQREKGELLIAFIEQSDVLAITKQVEADFYRDNPDAQADDPDTREKIRQAKTTQVVKAFYAFASEKCQEAVDELINELDLHKDAAISYIQSALKDKRASRNGMQLNETLPCQSPLDRDYLDKKNEAWEKISALVHIYHEYGITLDPQATA